MCQWIASESQGYMLKALFCVEGDPLRKMQQCLVGSVLTSVTHPNTSISMNKKQASKIQSWLLFVTTSSKAWKLKCLLHLVSNREFAHITLGFEFHIEVFIEYDHSEYRQHLIVICWKWIVMSGKEACSFYFHNCSQEFSNLYWVVYIYSK